MLGNSFKILAGERLKKTAHNHLVVVTSEPGGNLFQHVFKQQFIPLEMFLLLLRLLLPLALLLGPVLLPRGLGTIVRSAMDLALSVRTDLHESTELAAFNDNGRLHVIARLLLGAGRLLAVLRRLKERVAVAGEPPLFRAVIVALMGAKPLCLSICRAIWSFTFCP